MNELKTQPDRSLLGSIYEGGFFSINPLPGMQMPLKEMNIYNKYSFWLHYAF